MEKDLMSPKEALEHALKWIKELELDRRPSYKLLRRREIRLLKPILVREEIKPGMKEEVKVPYYYLVRFGLEKETNRYNKPLARIGVIVNAYTGKFEEIGAFSRPVKFLSKKGAIRIAAKAMNLSVKEIEEMQKDNLIRARTMYQPSEITHIRIYPFWEVKIKENILYVDQLGKLYGSIEPSRPGD